MGWAKALAKGLLSNNAYRYGGAARRLLMHPGWVARTAMSAGAPTKMLYFGIAPGDDLLCSAVLRELASRGNVNLWMVSNYPELFFGNSDVQRTLKTDPRLKDYAAISCAQWIRLEYAAVDWEGDRSDAPQQHIIAELCRRAGISGRVSLRPYYFPTSSEKARFSWAHDTVAIQSSGLGGKMKMANKQWYPERFQSLVYLLRKNVDLVQVGTAEDPPLAGVARNMQGKTTIRELGAILANCRLFVGNVGFLMHLARAVGCRSVIVYGGREAPWQSGYSCNVNLYSAEPCAPCWFWNKCEFNRACMDKITTEQVAAEVTRAMYRPRCCEDEFAEVWCGSEPLLNV